MRIKNIWLLSLVLFSCSSGKKNEGVITGKLNNAKGVTVVLEVVENNIPRAVDSAVVSDEGSFTLKLPYGKRSYYRLKSSADKNSLIILSLDSTEQITLQGDATRLYDTYRVKGSVTSQRIEIFFHGVDKINAEIARLESQMRSFNPADTTRGIQIGKLHHEYMQKREDFVKHFIDKNPYSSATFLALGYLDIEKHTAYFKKVASAMSKAMPGSGYTQSLNAQIGQFEYQLQQVEMAKQQMEERLKPIRQQLPAGSTPPDIRYPSPKGNIITLSSMKGKVVLVDFWASWCRPCRMENPNVVRLYNLYKDKGFTIYSVSLDKEKAAWEQAIAQDGLIWPNHVSELKQWESSVVQSYGIGSLGIPFTVLLDKNGKVIDVGLRGEALAEKLKELLGS